MVKLITIYIVLIIVLSKSRLIHQLDVHNVFRCSDLHEMVYMHQSFGFRDPLHPYHLCCLRKSLNDLKKMPCALYQCFANYVSTIGFQHNDSNHSLFLYWRYSDMTYMLLNVDDIILITTFHDLRKSILVLLAYEGSRSFELFS